METKRTVRSTRGLPGNRPSRFPFTDIFKSETLVHFAQNNVNTCLLELEGTSAQVSAHAVWLKKLN